MLTIAIVLSVVVTALAVLQVIPGLGFVAVLRRPKPALPADEACPKTVVLLSVRGRDPFLAKCIEGLLTQDYPNYDVRIVVDHPEDPAWEVIREVIDRSGAQNVTAESLENRLETCTLKCSGLLHLIAKLDESYEIVAVLDSDTAPHRTWLRELVGPFADPTVGVASGNRWYMPKTPTLGSLVRYVWNAAAVVQMYWNRFTWGGSVAIRANLVLGEELQDRWRHAVASDTAIYGVVRKHGLRAAFVPSLMMVNRETCNLGGFYGWVQRQLLVGRLQHGGWTAVFLHGMVTSLALLATIVALVAALVTGAGTAAAWLGGSLAIYLTAMVFLLALMEGAVRRIARERGEPTQWLSPTGVLKMIVALPLTQILYTAALPTVAFMRDVSWRGVAYRVEGPWNVKLVKYEPFRDKRRTADSTVSL